MLQCLPFYKPFPPALTILLFYLDFVLSKYLSLNCKVTNFIFQFIFVIVIINQLIYLIIWIEITRYSSDYSLSSLYKSITTTDSNDTMNDGSRNLMHETNDNICIRENAKITQHDTEFENSD